MKKTSSLAGYPVFLASLKERIVHARTTASRAVNRELILLYWDIGRGIVERQRQLGWGEGVIARLSADIQAAFPRISGFSPRNMRDMKRFYLAYADEANWRKAFSRLPKSLVARWFPMVEKLETSLGSSSVQNVQQVVAHFEESGSESGSSAIRRRNIAKRSGDDVTTGACPMWRQPVATLAENGLEPASSSIWPQPVAKMAENSLGTAYPQIVPQPVAKMAKENQGAASSDNPPQAVPEFMEEGLVSGIFRRFGWSRNVLLNQIKAGAYERALKEKKTHNFDLAVCDNLSSER